jgi:ribulose-5-phosphate 4-epimerase/fuculose-1-phosphate aldolase
MNDTHHEEWKNAAQRLLEKGIIQARTDEALSLRLPGRSQMLGGHFNGKSLTYDLTESEPIDESMAFSGARLHAAIYRARPDTGAILFSRQEWGSALNELVEPMPGIFDEQVRQLGRSIRPLKGVKQISNFRRKNPGFATLLQLKAGEQVYCVAGGLLILGHTAERAVFNAELVEKCAKAYLIACATGLAVKKVPLYVRILANLRLQKDRSQSKAAYASGRKPDGFKAY